MHSSLLSVFWFSLYSIHSDCVWSPHKTKKVTTVLWIKYQRKVKIFVFSEHVWTAKNYAIVLQKTCIGGAPYKSAKAGSRCSLVCFHIYNHERVPVSYLQWLDALKANTVNSDHYLLGTYYLLGACFLPGTRHHLLSPCALNRVHAGGEGSSENYDTKAAR